MILYEFYDSLVDNSYKTYVKFLPKKLYDELPEKCQNKIKEVCLKLNKSKGINYSGGIKCQ